MTTETGFILDEDEALKLHLQGLTVQDRNEAARVVSVYFRLPEDEVRRLTYPYITLDLISISEAEERAHRGILTASTMVFPANNVVGFIQGQTPKFEYPIPLNLDYQVTTYARFARHDRALLSHLMQQGLIPSRFGQVYVPSDQTVRRLDVISGPNSADLKDHDGKRLFRKICTVRMSAEISSWLALTNYRQAILGTNLTILDITTPS